MDGCLCAYAGMFVWWVGGGGVRVHVSVHLNLCC